MVTSVFLDFVRVVVDGDVDEVSRRLARSPGSCDHAVRRGRDTSGRLDLLLRRHRSLPLCGRHGAPHGCGGLSASGLRNSWSRTEPTAGRRIAEERSRFTTRQTRTGGIRRPQAETIEYLVSIGADPNAVDRAGVTPLHSAVRTRSLAAVRALLDGGANPRQPNKAGSTPLHLAVQTTGRGGSGSPRRVNNRPASSDCCWNVAQG